MGSESKKKKKTSKVHRRRAHILSLLLCTETRTDNNKNINLQFPSNHVSLATTLDAIRYDFDCQSELVAVSAFVKDDFVDVCALALSLSTIESHEVLTVRGSHDWFAVCQCFFCRETVPPTLD